jgi:hypothetical protein
MSDQDYLPWGKVGMLAQFKKGATLKFKRSQRGAERGHATKREPSSTNGRESANIY